MTRTPRFGWLSPAIGNRLSERRPIVVDQDTAILPTALPHFDSLWLADHFYGMDAPTDPFMEAWTTLTWLAARHERVELCHHVLGVGYRHPPLLAKMAATLQHLSGGRFVLGHRRGLACRGVRRLRVRLPEALGAVRAARGGRDDLPADVDRRTRRPSRGSTSVSRGRRAAAARPAAAGLHRGGRARRSGCRSWGGSPTCGTRPPGEGEAWTRRHDIVRRSAEEAGRDPASIEVSVTLERALPETDDDSARLVEEMSARHAAGGRPLRHGLREPAVDRAGAALRRAGHRAAALAAPGRRSLGQHSFLALHEPSSVRGLRQLRSRSRPG